MQAEESFFLRLKDQTGIEDIFNQNATMQEVQQARYLFSRMNNTQVQNFLNYAAKIDDKKSVDVLLPRVHNVDTALKFAAEYNNEKIVDKLLPKAHNVNAALAVAATHMYKSIVSKLLPKVQNIDDALSCLLSNQTTSGSVLWSMIDQEKTEFEKILCKIDFLKKVGIDLSKKYHAITSPDHDKIKEALLIGSYRYDNWIKKLLQNNNDQEITDLTYTEKLLQKHKREKARELVRFCEEQNITIVPLVGCYGELDYITDRIAQVEKEAKSRGFTTFVHARRWEWGFLNDMWNLIRVLKYKDKSLLNQISLRYRDEDCNEQELLKGRKYLVKDGSYCGSATNRSGPGRELTCVNRTIFSNWDWPYECTGFYFLTNFNCAVEDKALEYAIELFENNGLSNYIDEVKALFEKHKSISNKGQLLCISVKNDVLNDIMYVAQPGGKKNANSGVLLNVSENVQYHQNAVNDKDDYLDTRCDAAEFYCMGYTDIPGEYNDTYFITSIHIQEDQQKDYEYKEGCQKLLQNLEDQGVTIGMIKGLKEV